MDIVNFYIDRLEKSGRKTSIFALYQKGRGIPQYALLVNIFTKHPIAEKLVKSFSKTGKMSVIHSDGFCNCKDCFLHKMIAATGE